LIYDCFTFFNELDLLEIRLNELNDTIDYFVLVEATHTHSGQKKPLFFNKNRERFKDFIPKIIHVIVDDFPPNPKDRWVLENFQRNAIMRGISNCNPKDIIIISDIDEIVSAKAIIKHKNKRGIKILSQKMYYYYFNNEAVNVAWKAPKMVFFKDIVSPQDIRCYPELCSPLSYHKSQIWLQKKKHQLRRLFGYDTIIRNGGWHFSYLGGADRIIYKIKSFAHSEYDNQTYLNREIINEKILAGEDLFSRESLRFKYTDIDDTFPKYLTNNIEKFSEFVLTDC